MESVVGKVHLILKALLKEANKNSQAVFSEEKTVRPAKKKKKKKTLILLIVSIVYFSKIEWMGAYYVVCI